MRVAFFQGVAKAAEGPLEVERISGLLQRSVVRLRCLGSMLTLNSYLARGEEELNELKAQRRKGRPASSRQDMLQQRAATEENEYVTGFWIPDMQQVKNLEQIRLWNGEWASLNNIKFVRLSKDGMIKQSSFPPKGES